MIVHHDAYLLFIIACQFFYGLPENTDLTRVEPDLPRDYLNKCRLACTGRSKQTEDHTRLYIQIDP